MSTTNDQVKGHVAPLRVVSAKDGTNWVCVADVAALLRQMADDVDKPDWRQSAADVLRMVAGTFEAGEKGSPAQEADPDPAQPCRSCGVRVHTYEQQIAASTKPVTLNAAPTPYGRWMVTRTAERTIAIPYESRFGPVARFREHVCAGPFGKPGGRS